MNIITKFFRWITGLSEMHRQINDLKTTISTLQCKAEKTYDVYEKAYAIILSLDHQDKTKKWWEDDDRLRVSDWETRKLIYQIRDSETQRFAKENPSLRIKKTFHGGCISCDKQLEKGVGYCLGCCYLMGRDYPDLSTKADK